MGNRKPLFLLAGHARNRDSALEAAVASAGVPRPAVAYIGAASGDSPAFYAMMRSALMRAGAGTVTRVKLTGRKPDTAAALDALAQADCIHIGGGDVERGMRVLRETGLIPHLLKLYDEGRAFSGLSAGSIMLGRLWIAWRDPDDDSSARPFPCLGLAPFPCDTHSEEDDFSELRALLSRLPDGETGYGIPSGAALELRPDMTLSARAAAVRVYRVTAAGVLRMEDLVPQP
jgi:peptidase E